MPCRKTENGWAHGSGDNTETFSTKAECQRNKLNEGKPIKQQFKEAREKASQSGLLKHMGDMSDLLKD
jgi:hypothetical protein